jgi:hypothetical protein
MWHSLQEIVLSGRSPSFRYDPNFPFDGILSHLRTTVGGNVHDRKIVNITSSTFVAHGGKSCDPKYVTEPDPNLFFASAHIAREPGQWIQFEFVEHTIKPTLYSMQSITPKQRPFLRNWVLEGSTDGQLWIELDRRTDEEKFNSSSAIGSFPISRSEEVRMIRLVLTGKAQADAPLVTYIFALQRFEVFGLLAPLLAVHCPYDPSTPMQGIIGHLSRICGRHVADANVVQVVANNPNNVKGPARNAANFNSGEKFCSANLPDQWLCYIFTDSVVCPTNYAVRAVSSLRGHPRQWVIEGSNDGTSWIELDSQFDINRKEAIVAFKIARPQAIRMIRLRQTGLNWESNDVLQLSWFELYGKLVAVPMDRIIAHLVKEHVGNLRWGSVVRATASTEKFHGFSPDNTLAPDQNNYFSSDKFPNQWISYDFHPRRINVTAYHVTTPMQSNIGHLRSWVLEGSGKEGQWVVIDERTDMMILNHPGATASFPVTSERNWKVIRLRQTGKNWSNDDQLVIASIDFSGYITYM